MVAGWASCLFRRAACRPVGAGAGHVGADCGGVGLEAVQVHCSAAVQCAARGRRGLPPMQAESPTLPLNQGMDAGQGTLPPPSMKPPGFIFGEISRPSEGALHGRGGAFSFGCKIEIMGVLYELSLPSNGTFQNDLLSK